LCLATCQFHGGGQKAQTQKVDAEVAKSGVAISNLV